MVLMYVCDIFTHISQGYIIGTGVVMWLPIASESILKNMGKNNR